MNEYRNRVASTSQKPETLYKYLPPERIDIIENQELRFSRPSEFNDEFDSHYLIPSAQSRQVSIARMRLKARLGVLCLTERPDDHVMWVNYASNHSGFVLGFDANATFFGDDKRDLRKVRYQKQPPVLLEPSVDGCFIKSEVWRPEKEWRCVREFQPDEQRTIGFEPSIITEIIFGSKMETWHIARIVLFAAALDMTHVTFHLSSPSRKDWAFPNKRKHVTLCGQCGGNGYLMDDADTVTT